MNFNPNETHWNFIQSKQDLPEIEKFEIKYGFEGFDERNNFLHMNVSRFEMDFKLRFREVSMSWNQGKLIGKSWKLGIWWNLANKLLVVPSFKKKVPSKYGSRIWISLEGGI
jgi:hypothetical protein